MPGGLCPLPMQLRPGEDGWSAGAINRIASDMAHLSRTLPFAVLEIKRVGLSRQVTKCLTRGGCGLDFAPVDTGTSEGWRFPATWTDDAGVERPLKLSRVAVSQAGTVACPIGIELTSSRSFFLFHHGWSGGDSTNSVAIVRVYIDDDPAWYVYGGNSERVDTDAEPPALGYYETIRDSLGGAYKCEPGTLVDAEVMAEARLWGSIHREADRVSLDAIPGTSTGLLEDWCEKLQVVADKPDEELRVMCSERYAAMGAGVCDYERVLGICRSAMGRFFLGVEVATGGGLLDEPEYTAVGTVGDWDAWQFDLGGGAWTSGRAKFIVRCTIPQPSEVDEFRRLATVDLYRALRRVIPATVSWNVASGTWILDTSALDVDTTL